MQGVKEAWVFPSISMQSTDRGVETQRTRPSMESVGSSGRRARQWEREAHECHMSSKTDGPEILGALRREGGFPCFTVQWLGSGPLPAQPGTVLGLGSPLPAPIPPLSSWAIPAHALQIPILAQGC